MYRSGDPILVLRATPASLGFAVFGAGPEGPRLHFSGVLEDLGGVPRLRAFDAGGNPLLDRGWDCDGPATQDAALGAVLAWLDRALAGRRLAGVGHHVPHGGAEIAGPLPVDPQLLARLRALVPLAPLAQPASLACIEAAMVQLSGVPQLACCDTAFHRSRPAAVDAYALPADFFARGIRRYGFHGLACESVVRQLMAEDPALGRGRLILAHIDAATELVAVKGGRCLDGTGGFASGDGLPSLGSAGPLDAGALLHLLEGEGLAPAALARLIEEEAGLASMAGLAGGLDAIEASGAPEAAAALDHFAWRVRRSIGGLAATLGGVDAVVFSGSVGEARPALRARICAGLFFLGIRADAERNAAGVAEISPPGARVRLLVRRADPARMVADHLLATLEEAVRAA